MVGSEAFGHSPTQPSRLLGYVYPTRKHGKARTVLNVSDNNCIDSCY